MRPVHAIVIVAALWAVTYLPGLGAIELKGEEGRRVLPAIAMLETGEWIVPFVGGEPYLRKPPLIHWLIAASFQLTSHRDEWAARLPSALSVLALAMTIVAFGSRWLSPGGAMIAAICAMTNLGMLEKGRLSELEALYIAMTGIALVSWITSWRACRSPRLVWTLPFVFLGIGLLTKGPLHLLFFYTVVIAVLWHAKRLRELWCVPHLLGIFLMLGVFALWAVPYLQKVAQLNATGVWTAEFTGRVAHSKVTFRLWIENLWNNFANFLPWLLFTPLWWNRRMLSVMSDRDAALFRGTRLAVVICGCGLILIPGVLSRYTLPLIGPASLLTALALRDAALLPPFVVRAWRVAVIALFVIAALAAMVIPFVISLRSGAATSLIIFTTAAAALFSRRRWTTPPALAVGTASAIALGALIFVVGRIPRINAAERTRPIGRLINAALPEGSALYVIHPGYEPELFYVHAKCLYLDSPRELPPHDAVVLLPASGEKKLAQLGRTFRLLSSFKDRGDKEFLLVAVDPAVTGASRSVDGSQAPR